MNIRTTFTIATIPLVLFMMGAVETANQVYAWGWGGWGYGYRTDSFGYGGGYDGYGHYGLYWHQNCCNGLSSGTIYRLGYNQGYIDSSNNNAYNCDGHSYTYCNGYSAGFSAGQNNNQPNNNNDNQQNQEQQRNSYS